MHTRTLTSLGLKSLAVTTLVTLSLASLSAHAALQSRDFNTDGVIDGYYDTTLDLTWWRNANQAAGTRFDDGFNTTNGFMTWQNAQDWVAAFTPFGISGWRLPSVDQACEGYNCSSALGELGHMFYVNLGGTAGVPLSDMAGPNYALFDNVRNGQYWSNSSYGLDPEQANSLDFADGNRSSDFKTDPVGAAWAVHRGDVLAVPEPAALTLSLLGLGAVAWLRSKPRQS